MHLVPDQDHVHEERKMVIELSGRRCCGNKKKEEKDNLPKKRIEECIKTSTRHHCDAVRVHAHERKLSLGCWHWTHCFLAVYHFLLTLLFFAIFYLKCNSFN